MEKKAKIVEARKSEQKAFRRYEKEQWEIRSKIREEEAARWRAEQDAERLKRELEKPNPYWDQRDLYDSTIEYCNGLLPKVKTADEAAAEVDHTNPEGYSVMSSKKDRSQEMYLDATKGPKSKNKGPKEISDENNSSSTTTKAAKPVKHTAATLGIFSHLKLPAPMTTAEVPDLLKKLQQARDKLEKSGNKWESDRKGKLEAAAKVAEAAEAKLAEAKEKQVKEEKPEKSESAAKESKESKETKE